MAARAAVVTGAGRGIGRAIACELARAGYGVALQARTKAALEETRAQIEAEGGQAVVVPGDVTEAAAAWRVVAAAEQAFGPLQAAVAGAGQARTAPLAATDAEALHELFEVNAVAPFHLIRAASEAMLKTRTAGRIVVVASTAAVMGMRYTAAYSASKHAVLGLVRSAALELARAGITVNAVCPGWVQTDMFEATVQNIAAKTRSTPDEARERIRKMVPMGEVLRPEEVAGLVRYVVSDAADRLTGQALVLDGGETIA